ncbi:hypothetical protein [Sporosarcina aquimarina]|nr:hypothetical protein [Sporosarcina aquimarina]
MGRGIGIMRGRIGKMARGIGIIKGTIGNMGELIGNREQFSMV